MVMHSLIIGVSLGASDFPSTVRPLVPALTFHQLFEGIGLGGYIVQVSTCTLSSDLDCQMQSNSVTKLLFTRRPSFASGPWWRWRSSSP